VVYKYALDKIPKAKAKKLFDAYTSFEKMHGNRQGVEEVILSKRRFQYEQEVRQCIVSTVACHILSTYPSLSGEREPSQLRCLV
jgi:hypothetical protein